MIRHWLRLLWHGDVQEDCLHCQRLVQEFVRRYLADLQERVASRMAALR